MRGIVWRGIVAAAVRLVLLGMPVMVVMVVMAVMVAPVTAQSVFINANGGYQVTKTDFTDTVDFTLFAEDGDFKPDYQVAAAQLFDVSGGVMLGRYGAVGVGVSRFRTQDDAAVTARLPHPLFFDRDRIVSGTASTLTREETALAGISILPAPDGPFIHPRSAEPTRLFSSHHRPGSEAVTQPALTCRGLEARASKGFLRHRSSLVSSPCQAGVLARAARQPAGTGSAQIRWSIAPNRRRVR